MKIPHVGLFGRLFVLFSITTVLLAVSIAFGSFTMSEEDAKAFLQERYEQIDAMFAKISSDPEAHKKIEEQALRNRVELVIEDENGRWTTSDNFPELETLKQHAEAIGELRFAKYRSKYYLLANHQGKEVAVTAKVANWLVYPGWLVYWPWCLAVVIFVLSYVLLKRILKPVNDAVKSAKMISEGHLEYRIESHPRTELAQLTKGLNKMASELKERFDAKNDLLMSISHEIRTPLARMSISLAMLEESDIKGDLTRDLQLLDTLVEQLLEGERLDKGNEVLSLSTFYLPTLIEDVISERGLSGRVDLVSDIPEVAVSVDVGRVKFVVRNLIKNALAHAESSAVKLLIEFDEVNLKICVQDDGKGIPDAMIEKVFDPFVQVDAVKNRSTQKGTGLGLYLCKRIALAHQGALTVKNTEPGCVFVFSLPSSVRVG